MDLLAAIILLSTIVTAFFNDAHAQVWPPLYHLSLPVIPVTRLAASEPSSILTDQAVASSDQVAALSADGVSNLVTPLGGLPGRQAPLKPDCPYCDSSVFPYCSDKLLHDACCCLNPYESGLPAQCQLADCSFLHANTCKEHRLITRCCCDRRLFYANR